MKTRDTVLVILFLVVLCIGLYLRNVGLVAVTAVLCYVAFGFPWRQAVITRPIDDDDESLTQAQLELVQLADKSPITEAELRRQMDIAAEAFGMEK